MTELLCPKDGKPMYSLRYQKRSKGKPKYNKTAWYWCEHCERPVQIKVMISEKGF